MTQASGAGAPPTFSLAASCLLWTPYYGPRKHGGALAMDIKAQPCM